MSIGVPIKLLHEAEGHIVTCETNTNEIYRGTLVEAEDNMNCQMTNATATYKDGRTAHVQSVYLRGSNIRFLILPDMLKNTPMFRRVGPKAANTGASRGKSAILRAQELLTNGLYKPLVVNLRWMIKAFCTAAPQAILVQATHNLLSIPFIETSVLLNA